jgi:DNA polymerase-3 subunit gamma/tau
VSLALYRRYRPETFEEVIGQDHVTQPLQRALSNQRVNHAYLFSGPRGCGKTTSARILARCLNCEQGPTPTPCGTCKSCTDLARGGPGSIDVIEIDAASHGGVDDARDLRERAFFAPVSARYKIYILDEAHMVSQAGFNALLKVVEEPPAHLKFIFATTEPEKVIGTIRSRTHHYPFRLVPPGVLRDYLAQVCEQESVRVDPDVLPLVVRAGAGSVRDSMSVLDQLLAGAGEDGVTYQMAVGLLGYTDAALLDEAVSAFAARNGAAAFQAVDHVVEGGHDPRRFLADLLERLRDLVILAAVPDAAEKGLITAPGDQLARMREQAAAFGPAELSRAADLVNAGLLEMRGATAPRLLLELICARVLLPSADDPVRGVAARLDRLERGAPVSAFSDMAAVGTRPSGPPAERPRPAEPPGPTLAAVPSAMAAGAVDLGGSAVAGPAQVANSQQAASAQDGAFTPPWRKNGVPGGGGAGPSGAGDGASHAATSPEPSSPGAIAQSPQPRQPEAHAVTPAQSPAPGGMTDAAAMRQIWPQVLEALRGRKVTWAILQDTHVVGVEGKLLQIGFANSPLRDRFAGSAREDELRGVLRQFTGADWKIDALVDPSGGTGSTGGSGSPLSSAPAPSFAASVPASAAAAAASAIPPSHNLGSSPEQTASSVSAPSAAPPPFAQAATAPEEDEPDPDDEDVDEAGPTARDLLMRELGATVLEERSDAD